MTNSARNKSTVRRQGTVLVTGIAFLFWLSFGISNAQQAARTEYIPFQPSYLSTIKNVEDIYQDRSGFIWLTTNYGLIRLDGRNASRLTKFNSSILKSNNFFRNLEIRSGELTFLRDELGNYYLPDGSGDLIDSDSSALILKSVLRNDVLVKTLPNHSMAYVISGSEAWIAEYPGYVKRFSGDGFYQTSITSSYGISSGFFTHLDGHTWINRSGKVFRILNDSAIAIVPKGLGEVANRPMWLFNAGFKKLFLYWDGQLYRCAPDQQGELTAVLLKGIRIDQQVTAVFEDEKTGFIYIASSAGGLQIFQPQRFTHITPVQLPVNQSAFFYTPLVYSKGKVLANIDRTLFLFDKGKANILYQDHPDFNYTALYKDRHGRIWFEPFDGRIVAVDPSTIKPRAELIHRFNAEIRHILEFNGEIFVLTNTFLFKLKEVLPQQYTVAKKWALFPDSKGVGQRTNTIYFTDEAHALIGHLGGLLQLDLQSGNLKNLAGFENFNVRTLGFVDGLGLMAGTYGDGYFLIKDLAAIEMPVDRDGALNSVHAFIPDRSGYLWMPTNEGLIRVLTSDLARSAGKRQAEPGFQRYTEIDGLVSDEFNGGTNPSFGISGDTIILPSSRGLAFIRTSDFTSPVNYPLTVFVTQGNLKKRVSGSIRIFSNEIMELEFDRFTAPPIGIEKVWFRIGPDGPWSSSEIGKTAIIDRLWGGDYMLEISPVDPLLGPTENLIRIPLVVEAVWYETTLFWIVVTLLAAGLIWMLIRLRTNAILAQRHALREEVRTKTEELRLINTQLEEKNRELSASMGAIREQIAFREKVLLVLLHDLKSPMRFVTSSMRRLYTGLTPDSGERSLSGEVMASVSGIYKFMEDFHNWVLQSNAGYSKTEYVSLMAMFEAIHEFYEQIAVVYGNRLEVNTEDLVLKTYSFTLKTIVGNLVDNALKNTRHGNVRLDAFDSPSYVIIRISDTGKGMTTEQVNRLLLSFESDKKMVTPSIGGGTGYPIIGEFLKRVGGLISIESEVGIGTTVDVAVPKNHG